MGDYKKKISLAVIKRLPRYHRYLGELLYNGIARISSKELSEKMNITPSQMRQDLNNFGCFGQQGYGYNVEYLYHEIGKILNLDVQHSLILIGVGNIGQALMNYISFEKRGFKFIAAFDANPKIVGMTVRGVKISDIDCLEQFLKQNDVDIAVLALPEEKSYEIANTIAKHNVKGIWNFSSADLVGIKNVMVENVHLTDSLMILSYKIGNQSTNKEFHY